MRLCSDGISFVREIIGFRKSEMRTRRKTCSKRKTTKRSSSNNQVLRRNAKGETKLHIACIAGNIEEVTKLLEANHPTGVRDYCGWTPLHEAANRGHVEIAELLIKSGANMNDPGGLTRGRATPLHDAASCGHLSMMLLLLKSGADFQAKNKDGETILDCLEAWKNSSGDLSPSEQVDYDNMISKLSTLLEQSAKKSSLSEQRNILKDSTEGNEPRTADFDQTIKNVKYRLRSNRIRSFPMVTEKIQSGPIYSEEMIGDDRNYQAEENKLVDEKTSSSNRGKKSINGTSTSCKIMRRPSINNIDRSPSTRQARHSLDSATEQSRASELNDEIICIEEFHEFDDARKIKEKLGGRPGTTEEITESSENESECSTIIAAVCTRNPLALEPETQEENVKLGPERFSNNCEQETNAYGETELHVACIAGNIEKVTKLLESNYPTDVQDFCGWTPLHEAANYGRVEIAELLIKSGANVDDPGGPMCGRVTPLHVAASCGHFSTIALLIENGANFRAKTRDGDTIISCFQGWKKRFGDLSPKQQDVFDTLLLQLSQALQKSAGKSPRAASPRVCSPEMIIADEESCQTSDNVKYRLRPNRRKIRDENSKYHLKQEGTESSHKNDGLKRNAKGETRLHIACIAGNVERVRKLLESNHPTDVQDYYGWTPLQEAANRGHVEIAELLIEHGANVNDPGGPMCGGITPLHDAAVWGHFSIMFLLIKKGANLHTKTREGFTILGCLETWKNHSKDTSLRRRAEYDSLHSRLSAACLASNR